MKSGKNTFINYLASYLIIMTIPALILSYIFYGYFLGFFTDYLQRDNLNALLRVQSNIDIQIAQLQSYAYRIANSQEFTTPFLTTNYSQFYEVFNSLSNIKYSNDFLSEVIYLNNDLNFIYMPNARFTFENFKNYGSSYDNYYESQLKNLFYSFSKSMWMPMQSIQNKTQQVLTYIIPIKYQKDSVNTAAIFQIQKSTLDLLVGKATTKN